MLASAKRSSMRGKTLSDAAAAHPFARANDRLTAGSRETRLGGTILAPVECFLRPSRRPCVGVPIIRREILAPSRPNPTAATRPNAAVPVRRMTLENAELAKISVNAFVTMKITFANMLAEMCAVIPGGDVDTVSDALGLDSRIGRKYLTGGLGFGGPCFPRDNIALSFIATALGARADLLVATEKLNRSLANRILEQLRPRISRDVTVAMLGLAYKPLSHVTEESQAIMMVKAFHEHGARVLAYDPLAAESANFELGGRALILDSPCDCLPDWTKHTACQSGGTQNPPHLAKPRGHGADSATNMRTKSLQVGT